MTDERIHSDHPTVECEPHSVEATGEASGEKLDQLLTSVTVEHSPHSVEGTGRASGDKLDQLLATAIAVKRELHTHIRRIVIAGIVMGVVLLSIVGAAGGVLWGLRGQAKELHHIAVSNGNNGRDIKAALTVLEEATGPEARERSRLTLALAINELRRSIDCVNFYIEGEHPPACEEVAKRMDSILAGSDPFVPPTTIPTP